MIDIHTHTLPHIDDGSESVEESLKMLEMQVKQGVDTVIATPHFYIDRAEPNDFLEKRRNAAEKLKKGLENVSERPRMALGAEVQFYSELHSLERLDEFCFSGTKYVLVEMPFAKWSRYTYQALGLLYLDRGITPVIAHLERYISYQDDDVIEKLIDANALIQINSSTITARATRRKALALVRSGAVCFVASDSHGAEHRRPDLGDGYKIITKKLGDEVLDRLEFWEYKVKKHLVTF